LIFVARSKTDGRIGFDRLLEGLPIAFYVQVDAVGSSWLKTQALCNPH